MAREVIAHMPNCEGGNCSTLWRDSDTGDVIVRGLLPDGTETDVVIPAVDWAHLRPQLP